MKCECCGASLDSLNVLTFDYEGSDYWDEIMIEECEKDAVVIDTDRNWTGYEQSEEEMRETIVCPRCRKWPFKSEELQIYETVRLVMFKEHEGGEKCELL